MLDIWYLVFLYKIQDTNTEHQRTSRCRQIYNELGLDPR